MAFAPPHLGCNCKGVYAAAQFTHRYIYVNIPVARDQPTGLSPLACNFFAPSPLFLSRPTMRHTNRPRRGKIFPAFFAAALLALCSLPAAAESPPPSVVVMTSYPEELVSLVEAGFEKAHPDTRVEIIWRRSGDAMSYAEENPGHIDVYWAPAQRAFAKLARKGAFKRLPADMAGLPAKVGGFPISDPGGLYAATEIAGFGFAVNAKRLREKKLPQPTQWTDLADPRWRDELIFPIPSRAGFAPPLVEILAQGYGWEKGWTLLQQIGSNARPPNADAPNDSRSIAKGRVSVAVSLDFFIRAAIDDGAPITFVYPGVTGYSPAHVGVFKDAPHPDAARTFAEYVLSDDGQKLLFHPDMRRLPVRPAVYAGKPEGYYDPFQAAKVMPFEFDNKLAQERQGLNNALYDVMVTDQHERLRAALATVAKAERAAAGNQAMRAKLDRARKLVTKLPITEQQANALSGRFVSNFEFADKPDANADLLRGWAEQVARNRRQAMRIAQQMIDAQPGIGGAAN